ncbi:MAG: hypothetical protein RIE08_16190 [Acidimicrobiales bacterium]
MPPTSATLGALPHELVTFAHNSERQFARLLDFYGVEWQYEPVTFTLRTDDRGNIVEAFSPDFHLPDYDLFVEITTQRQQLVTKKNRKVRQLRERHPHLRIKILYQRDYLGLLVKYGLEEPSQFEGTGEIVPAIEQGDTLMDLGDLGDAIGFARPDLHR